MKCNFCDREIDMSKENISKESISYIHHGEIRCWFCLPTEYQQMINEAGDACSLKHLRGGTVTYESKYRLFKYLK